MYVNYNCLKSHLIVFLIGEYTDSDWLKHGVISFILNTYQYLLSILTDSLY